ncbi:hypothetical protein AVEN_125174-1, partial [Araneus ventricosus]
HHFRKANPILLKLGTHVPHYMTRVLKGKISPSLVSEALWGKVSKIHVTNRPIGMLADFGEASFTCSSLADLKYGRGK